MGPVVDWLAVVGAGVGASRLGAGERGGGGHIAYGEHVAVLQSLNAACSTIGVYISLGVCGGEALAEFGDGGFQSGLVAQHATPCHMVFWMRVRFHTLSAAVSSAAAVAAGECYFALGSDTGGSIRQPAGFCGVVGMKPTYGTVSRYGLIAYGSSLDQIGPLCRDVSDCAAVLEAISSHDTKDSTSMERETDFTSALTADVSGMRIGIPRDYLGEGLDGEVKEAVLRAAGELEKKGAVLEEFDLSLVEYAIPAYYTIASAEPAPIWNGLTASNTGIEPKIMTAFIPCTKDTFRRLWPGSETPYYAGILRPELRLL